MFSFKYEFFFHSIIIDFLREISQVGFLFLFLAAWNLFFLSHLCALKYLFSL